MAITLDSTLTTEGTEAVLEAFRKLDGEDLAALRHGGGLLAARLAEAVLGERSHREALEHELAQARQDVVQFEAHVESYKAALKKAPTGTARVELEDLVKQYQTRLDGARGNVEAVEREVGKR